MKKSLKVLAAGLLIAPCMLALTACGESAPEYSLVDTKGSYKEASSYQTMQEYVDENDASTELEGYRLLSTFELAAGKEKLEYSTDSFISVQDNRLNMKMVQTMSAGDSTQTISTYIKDNYLTSNVLGEYSMPILIDGFEFDNYTSGTLSFDELFANFTQSQLDGMTVRSETTDNTTKFKLTLSGELLESFVLGNLNSDVLVEILIGGNFKFETSHIYYNFANDQFAGAGLDMAFSATFLGLEGSNALTCKTTMEFVPYTQEIDFPEELPEFPEYNEGGNEEGGDVLVNIDGDYATASSYSDLKALAGGEFIDKTSLSSYEYKSTLTMTMMPTGGDEALATVNASVTEILVNVNDAYQKIASTADGNTDVFEFYFKDGYKFQPNTEGGWLDPTEEELLIQLPTFGSLLDSLETSDIEGLTINSEVAGDITKFKVELDASLIADFLASQELFVGVGETLTLYFVFDGENFDGIVVDYVLTMDDPDSGMTNTISFKIEYAATENLVEFPEDLPVVE